MFVSRVTARVARATARTFSTIPVTSVASVLKLNVRDEPTAVKMDAAMKGMTEKVSVVVIVVVVVVASVIVISRTFAVTTIQYHSLTASLHFGASSDEGFSGHDLRHPSRLQERVGVRA
jgi:hypothetical protein